MTKVLMETFHKYRGEIIALFLILLLASFFRLWNFTSSDMITDEASLSFRAIGLIDFDAAKNQSSPWEWSDPPPKWMRLSMHDHPIFYFLTLHASMKLFGENIFAIRLPSAIFGIASILLIYGISKKLFNEAPRVHTRSITSFDNGAKSPVAEEDVSHLSTGLRPWPSAKGDRKSAIITAILSSTNVYMVWVSRLGLQESLTIFLMLITLYYFIKCLEDERYFLLSSFFLGLALITKYTTFILLPIIILYLVITKRKFFLNKFFWFGIGITLFVFSPVIIYNLKLYQTFGHFDFQLSYLFRQNVSLWQIQPGKEEFKNISEKFFNFFINLKKGLSPAIFWIFWISFLWTLYECIKRKSKSMFFLAISSVAFFFMYLFIGPSQRFLSMIIPFIIIIISQAILHINTTVQKLPHYVVWKFLYIFILGALFISEIIFSYQTNLSIKPKRYYSQDIHSNFSYSGYNELERWLKEITKNKKPLYSFEMQYNFLKKISEETKIQDQNDKNKSDEAFLFVYDENMNEQATLWILHRQSIYHSWPIVSSKEYLEIIKEKGNDFFQKQGFKKIFLIEKTEYAVSKKFSPPEYNAKMLKLYLNLQKPTLSIKNRLEETAFNIYDISLNQNGMNPRASSGLFFPQHHAKGRSASG